MAIFAAGIVWDPREPLPRELQERGPSREADTGISRRHHKDVGMMNTAVASNPSTQFMPTKPVADLVVKEPDRNILSPWSIDVAVSILHDTATFKVTQTFLNNADEIIPGGSYTFPLPTGCTVTSFDCRIGTDKTLKGVVKPRKEGRELFEDSVRHGHVAGLLEHNTSEIFTTALGNIPANTKVKIELGFISLLKHHFADSEGTTTLTIPT